MTFIDLFKTGLVDYKDLGISKPVKFTEEQLKAIASQTGTINLTNEHNSNEIIGSLSNFIYEDNTLKVEAPNFEIGGKGISPIFDCDLVDKGEYYEPINLLLKEGGLVNNPRSGILYNNIQGDVNMADDKLRELLDKKEERVMEQQEEIALLKKQLEEAKTVLESQKGASKELETKLKELDETKANLENFRNDAEKYRQKEAEAKAELIREITGDTEAPYLEKLSYEDLQHMKDSRVITEPPKGAVSTTADDLDMEGDQEPPKPSEEDKYTEESFDKWDKENTHWGNNFYN